MDSTNHTLTVSNSPVGVSTTGYVYATPATQPVPAPIQNVARQINIEPVNFGYIVRIGCQTFAIETKEKLTTYLSKYLANPAEVETEWMQGTLKIK